MKAIDQILIIFPSSFSLSHLTSVIILNGYVDGQPDITANQVVVTGLSGENVIAQISFSDVANPPS
jgi:hypothetical protein